MPYRLFAALLLISFITCVNAEKLNNYELDLLNSQYLKSKTAFSLVNAQKHLVDGKWNTYVRVMVNPRLSTKRICKSNIADLEFEYLENDVPNYKYPKDHHKSTMVWILDINESACKSYAYGKKTIASNLIPERDLFNILRNKTALVESALLKKPKLRPVFTAYLKVNKLKVSSLEIITNRMNDNVYSAQIDFGLQCHGLSVYFEIEKEQFVVESVFEVVC